MSVMVSSWTAEQKAAFNKAPVKFAHGLSDTGLFSDEALAQLLDRWPAELYDINLFDFDDQGQHVMRTGVRGQLSGEKALQGVKDGRVWLQLRQADRHNPALAAAMKAAFDGISRQVKGFRPANLNAQLIISAPAAKVPFHADAPGVVLFHLRGRKRIWIYPNDEAHMPQAQMENINLKQQTEDLPYTRAMDAAAKVFDLEPGEAVAWPLHSPHRIENQGVFNVSLSVDYQTWGSRIINGAHYTNGLLRRAGAKPRPMGETPVAARTALWASHLALKRFPILEDRIKGIERSFELDGKPIPA
jgi:hypothetical protein